MAKNPRKTIIKKGHIKNIFGLCGQLFGAQNEASPNDPRDYVDYTGRSRRGYKAAIEERGKEEVEGNGESSSQSKRRANYA